MYHQFKELAGVDITTQPMEVGPTTHYAMGGIRVDSDTQMSSVEGLFAAGECGAGLHGANRLGGNSLSDLLVFGKRCGEHATAYAKDNGAIQVNEDQVNAMVTAALQPLERGEDKSCENPYTIQHDLQEMMQDQVGIVRNADAIAQALESLEQLKHRATTAGVTGNREYNPGWHTALDLQPLLTVSEAIARSALLRCESRGAHSREDYPQKDAQQAKVNTITRKMDDGKMHVQQEPIPAIRDDLKQIIKEMK
jgi:succinate dehydrogenase / fumarate reductase flavoprotein subunit